MIDREFVSRSGQSNNYEIGICYFSSKNIILRSKRKGWLSLNQNNMWTVSYYYANSTTRVSLVQCGYYNHFTECIFLAMKYIENCSSSVIQQPINHWTRKQLGWPFRRCLLCWYIYIYSVYIYSNVYCELFITIMILLLLTKCISLKIKKNPTDILESSHFS